MKFSVVSSLTVVLAGCVYLMFGSSSLECRADVPSSPPLRLVEKARSQVGVTFFYDPEYRKLAYPNGDVPLETGVCTDVVIRAMRGLGLDLQKEVHEDMKKNFSSYPKLWEAKSPDRNIDHRRVPNLMTYFKRKGWSVPITAEKGDYKPGDIVTWVLPNGMTHIGLVSDRKESDETPLIIHNIGAGAQEENCLFVYKITGHYRPLWKSCTEPKVQKSSS